MTRPADPTSFTIDFHSSGRLVIRRRMPDGSLKVEEFPNTPQGTLLVLTANPGGSGLLDSEGKHDLTMRAGAYFRIEVQRLY